MELVLRRELDGVIAHVAHTTRDDGDMSPSTTVASVLEDRRRKLVAHRWYAARQVHSDRVVEVSPCSPWSAEDRPTADALVARQSDLVLAVHAGDCAGIGLVHETGAVAAVHAGWKGLERGVIESAVRALRRDDAGLDRSIVAAVGPHIRVDRYEFGLADLERLAARFGPEVIGRTGEGRPALDLTAALAAEFERLDVAVAFWSSACTARDQDHYWSHRARREAGRIALMAWTERR